jgi:hypothetical protein
VSQTDIHKKQIGEHNYEVYMLPAMESHNLLMTALRIIGPSLGPVMDHFMGKSTKDILNTDLKASFFSDAIQLLFQNLDQQEVVKIINRFAEKTLVDGKKLKDQFDTHFMGKLDMMYQWFAFAIQVQWGNSLGALWSLTPMQSAVKESQ